LTAESALRDVRPALRNTLAAAAEELRLPLSAEQSRLLLDYVELLAHWNRTYNLTAVRDPASMLTQHVVDCLAAVPAVRRERRGGRVLDVGSGGGLPGVVWAIMDPEFDVTCVDSVGKKAAFVQQASSSLALRNLHSQHARVETLSSTRFDLVTARAFAALPDFVAMTAALLAEGGAWLAMKGKVPAEEISALASDIEVFHVEQLVVPGVEADRCLVWMRHVTAVASTDLLSTESVHSHSSSLPETGRV
jgi:16S rRNA (guanine527-N7)-methyltransferase